MITGVRQIRGILLESPKKFYTVKYSEETSFGKLLKGTESTIIGFRSGVGYLT